LSAPYAVGALGEFSGCLLVRRCPMKKAVLGRVVLLLAVVGGGTAYGAASSCVGCHTDVGTMKAMVPPPVASTAEGEG
jgi:hypothetical protein